jgi:hypothetical protein
LGLNPGEPSRILPRKPPVYALSAENLRYNLLIALMMPLIMMKNGRICGCGATLRMRLSHGRVWAQKMRLDKAAFSPLAGQFKAA